MNISNNSAKFIYTFASYVTNEKRLNSFIYLLAFLISPLTKYFSNKWFFNLTMCSAGLSPSAFLCDYGWVAKRAFADLTFLRRDRRRETSCSLSASDCRHLCQLSSNPIQLSKKHQDCLRGKLHAEDNYSIHSL